jgi:hypothetical protein
MDAPGERRSDRVSLTLLLEASGRDIHGKEFKDPATTLLINRTGAVIVTGKDLAPDQTIHLRRQAPSETHRQGMVRVVGQFGRQKDGYLYGIEILDDATDLWGVEFPPVAQTPEAVARMLLECTYCGTREVVYLNEVELRGFEANRGTARHCKTCRVPSIWTQAPHEDVKKLTSQAARKRRAANAEGEVPESGERRARERTRLKTRLTACIRQAGSDDELAVCEDISPLGICFRSKRRYEAEMLIEVAVPYAPDSANIFLPARVIYSEEIPKAGLFRHGTEYRKIGPRAR